MAFNLIGAIRAKSSNNKKLYQSIKNIFGFYPENIFLYELALRHKSIADEIHPGAKNSNERLEFLGDAILDAVIADFLFKLFPYKDEGFLTKMRSKIVSRVQLNKLSIKLGINQLVQSTKDIYSQPKSINGDAFEAIIGAMYIDKGYDFTRRIIIEKIVKLHLDIDELENTETNFKSRLIEWAQKEKKDVEFKVVREVGNGNKRQHIIELFVDHELIATAKDFSIKGAEQLAAEKAFNKLDELLDA